MATTSVECRFICGDFEYRELDRLQAEGWKPTDYRMSKDGFSIFVTLYREDIYDKERENDAKQQENKARDI